MFNNSISFQDAAFMIALGALDILTNDLQQYKFMFLYIENISIILSLFRLFRKWYIIYII